MVDRQEAVETLAKSVHNYWHDRRQVNSTWDEAAPIFQHVAREAALEWLGPVWEVVDRPEAELRAILEELAAFWDSRGWKAGSGMLRAALAGERVW